MTKCSIGCHPCCDFCIHVWWESWVDQHGHIHVGSPAGCSIHIDKQHKDIAECNGYCNDFHCFNAYTEI